MNKSLSRALLLPLCLLIFLLPLCAHAEQAVPSAAPLNMTSVTVRNIRYDDGDGETVLPLTVDLTFGADLPARRSMALISLNAGNTPFTVMASMEEEEIRARIAGIDPLLTASLPMLEDELIRSILLLGLEYEDCSEETLKALDEYLALLEESMAVPAQVVDSRNFVEAMYPLEAWKEDFEKHPGLLNAVYAGEEEITLFGKAYTAKKYTYSMQQATEEEFLAFYEAYDEHYFSAGSALEEAYETLIALVYEDLEASMQTSDLWKDDGSVEESESGSLSEWDEAERYEYIYNIEGTIWQVDEVLGTLEEYTAVTRGPEGEYIDTYVCSDMLTGDCMRYEASSTETVPYGYTSSVTESMTVQTAETGRILMDGMTISGVDYADDPEYSYATNLGWRSEMTEDRLTISMNETASGLYETDQVMSMTADFALGQEEDTGLISRAAGTVEIAADLLGGHFTAAMDMDMLLSALPEGTLLPVVGETIDLFEADEETLDALLTDLETVFMQAVGSLIPAPEAPSSVGGALLG